jgi:formylglycine-generating enzyme required for sulfatase activity
VALVALACAAPVLAQDHVAIEAADIVWIPGGAFTMGATEADVAYAISLCQADLEVAVSPLDPGSCEAGGRFLIETPERRVSTPTFGMDRTEVTNAAYRRCVLAGRCAPSATREGSVLAAADHPVVGVRWTDARAYCRFVSGRLPSEAEWEKAARGDDVARRFPWGRVYDSHLANHGRAPIRTDPLDGFLETAPVGSFPSGASPYGILDLAGNVLEWTNDVPTLPFELGVDLSASRGLRGGSYIQSITSLRVTARSWATTDTAASDVGFRCAYDP